MKLGSIILAVVYLLSTSNAFTINEYVDYIDTLMKDQSFLSNYTEWAAQLFADPTYLYGGPMEFPCSIPKNIQPPRNVHELSPIDVNCVGALGDSLTAALGAHAITPLGLMIENRGVSWSIGGDSDFSQMLTFPNVIRKYQLQLQGISTKFSVMFLNGQNASSNGLNIAESGDVADDMPGQAAMLIDRMQKKSICDWQNDWKVVTLFIGGNDLCGFCKDGNAGKYTPENYVAKIQAALDTLYASMPRTLVNVIPIFDVSQVESLNSGGFICQIFHKLTCPCAAYPTDAQRAELAQMIPQFQAGLNTLVNSGRYDGRDDFTVVVQPFFTDTILPKTMDGKPDFSLFAPDCFHFSGKGHSYAALSLWNNMLEPVDGKQTNWHYGEPLKCPSDKYPYFFTKKNSAQALAEGFNMNKGSTPRETTRRETTPARSASSSTSSLGTTARETSRKPHDHDKHHDKHEKSGSMFSTIGFVSFLCIFVLLLIIIIVSTIKRRQHRALNRNQYSEDDDVEIYSRSTEKLPHGSKGQFPRTHGTRINFD